MDGILNMDGTLKKLFGPLDQKYCNYFLFLSILGFVMLILFLISLLFVGISKKKSFDFYLGGVFIALTYFLFYFQSRLLHSMCAGTLVK